MLHVSLQSCLCPLYRAVIREGHNAGRLTLIADDDNSVSLDNDFASSCCTKGGGCEKYTSRRPLTPIGPPDMTKRM